LFPHSDRDPTARGDGWTELIRDDQLVRVHKGERFLAIPRTTTTHDPDPATDREGHYRNQAFLSGA
jgi:hypothetical protein